MNLQDIRKEYSQHTLNDNDIHKNPIQQFQQWFDEAIKSEVIEVNAMVLSSVDQDHKPHSRIVLLKEVKDGTLKFFTNYHSDKGSQLAVNPNGALLFFWAELERQIRIEGVITKVSEKESDEYFYSRPIGSQIGAIISNQSSVLKDKSELDEKYNELINHPDQIKRPEHWGGYALTPTYFEFWQGRPSRLHDRISYRLVSEDNWEIKRLFP